MIKRALISVSDKTGIVDFAQKLASMGVEIISTGGTMKALKEAGVAVTGISEVTGFPECLDGRVKTLHPNVHAGILAMRDRKEHMDQLASLGIGTIDMVVINLYPFKQTIMKPGVTLEEAIENIDIGGPTMLRSAAKNYRDVTVVVDCGDYCTLLAEMEKTGVISEETNLRLSWKVFEHTSHYDALIAKYLRNILGVKDHDTLTLTFEKVQDLRYGENPHQQACFYKESGNPAGCLTGARQLHGKELSYNNINDANGALEALKEFKNKKAVVAVKHANPCGVGIGDTILEAYKKAYEADPVAIFGGIVAANDEIDLETAMEINRIFIEIVIAPAYSPEALAELAGKKNIRILILENITDSIPEDMMDMKRVTGGLLVQDYDKELLGKDIQYVTRALPTEEQMSQMLFAMRVCKHAKSNAIVLARDNGTVGIGPGQVSRISALEAALRQAGEKAKGAVLASDAFFPFSDCVELAARAGINAIIQPGGSKNDQESIDACDKHGIAMVFTGMRHFRH